MALFRMAPRLTPSSGTSSQVFPADISTIDPAFAPGNSAGMKGLGQVDALRVNIVIELRIEYADICIDR